MPVVNAMQIDSVSPRGGPVGAAVTVDGDGFGVATGRVIFDPNGVNVLATVTSWTNNQVQFTVPAGVLTDRFSTVVVERADFSDIEVTPFWVPAAAPAPEFQFPSAEAGPNENEDDPRVASAADFNRLIDLIRFIQANAVGDMTKAVYDPGDDGKVDAAEVADAIDDSGTPRTWADIVALVTGLTPVHETFVVPSNGHTTFTITQIPTGAILFMVNHVPYFETDHFTRGGAGNRTLTWLDNDFGQLTTTDRVDVLYFT